MPPLVNYRIFVAHEDEETLRRSAADLEPPIARFFKLSPVTDVAYQIQDET